MQQALLRLFNAVQIKHKNQQVISEKVYRRTIGHGYMLDPAISPSRKLLDEIESVIGLSGEKANQAFHKSWRTVQDCKMETLVIQQVIHYITTYGFQQAGIYRDDAVYIPKEVLEVPALSGDLPLTLVKAMPVEEVLQAITDLGSGIALAEETLRDIMTVVEANKFASDFVENIQNRELKARLYDYYGMVPQEPVAYLRYVISKLTNESLLIKNDALIEKIKAANGKFLDVLLRDAPEDLASIFHRYKPLFLAMKSISKNKTFFNHLRKDAVHMHKPLGEDYLNSVTAQIKHGVLASDVLSEKLERANIFRKIRLAYALKHRLHAGDSIVYRVRNGKGWVSGFAWPEYLHEKTEEALEIVKSSIVREMTPKVSGKTVLIPAHVRYTLPATEKQFTGHFPTGSSIEVTDDLIAGVHWYNTKKCIDLDLSVISESGKFGWDADYRSKDRDVLFSGDMTSAPRPKGATELFYIRSLQWEAKILMLNFYNYSSGDEVPAKILVASEQTKKFGQNYMVDPNNILATANINVSRKQNVLGLIVSDGKQNRVYFAHISVGTSITSSRNAQTNQARKYLVHSLLDSLDLSEFLTLAGANVIESQTETVDIDLSPEKLDKKSIIALLH